MRTTLLTTLALAALTALPVAQAGTYVGGGVVVAPGGGYRGGWVGGPGRPWVGPGYGYAGWGYGGWRYGYPGYGYGFPGYGYGWGLGYGAAWALAATSPWYWGAPAVYPYAVVAPSAPAFEIQAPLIYVQQAPASSAEAAPAPATTPSQPGFWYYCTEPAGYHPYVQQCTRPWIAVNPQSTPAAGAARPAGAAP